MQESKRSSRPPLAKDGSDSDQEDAPTSPVDPEDVLDGGAGRHSPEQPIEEFSVGSFRFKGAGIGFIAAFIITGIACFLCPPGNAIITVSLIAFWGSLGGTVGAIIGAIIDNHSFACLSSRERDNLDDIEELEYNEGQGRYSFIGSMRSTWTSLKERLANAVHRTPANPPARPGHLPAAIAVPPAPAPSFFTSFFAFFQRTPPAAQPAAALQADQQRASPPR